MQFYCGVEQWSARRAHNSKVGGSNPPSATKDAPLGKLVKSLGLGPRVVPVRVREGVPKFKKVNV